MKYNSKTQAFILFSLSILGAALLLSYKKEGKETAEEEVEQTTLQRSEANHKRLKTVVDSTYSDWHVIVQETDIKTKHSRVGSKLLVTISKSGKTLFNKEVITPSILDSSLDNHFQLTSVYLKGITNTTDISLWRLSPGKQMGRITSFSRSQEMGSLRNTGDLCRWTTQTLSWIFTSCTRMKTYRNL